jgi:hypothetical protein
MRTPACEHVIGFRALSRRCSRPTLLGRWLRVFAETVVARQLTAVASANEVTMRTTSESLSPSEASHRRGAEGNCVAARRGGEQPEAKPQTQTQVKPIRPPTMASQLANGEACGASHDRTDRHDSSKVRERIVAGGWAGYAGKLSWWTVESCAGRNPQERVRAEVRAAIVAWKRGNALGAKGGRKRNHLGKQAPSNKHDRIAHRARSVRPKEPWRTFARRPNRTLATEASANSRLESRVREIRMHGSEGGAGQSNALFLPLSTATSSPEVWGSASRPYQVFTTGAAAPRRGGALRKSKVGMARSPRRKLRAGGRSRPIFAAKPPFLFLVATALSCRAAAVSATTPNQRPNRVGRLQRRLRRLKFGAPTAPRPQPRNPSHVIPATLTKKTGAGANPHLGASAPS